MFALPTSHQAVEALLDGWSATGRRRVLQVAVAGRWEESRSIEMPTDAAGARSLVCDAGPADADVAVEFEWLGRPLVFVGARRTRELASERADFVEGVVHVAAIDPADPGLALATLAGGSPAALDHIELGAANAWQSVGPLRLWSHGEDRAPRAVEARLREHPALARCVVPVALEVAFRRPRACWIGVEVSEPSGDEHVVCISTVETKLARLFNSARPSDRQAGHPDPR
jgi:hypothetical protein